MIGIDDDFDVERLAFTNLGGDFHGGSLHFGIAAHRQGKRVDRDAAAEGTAAVSRSISYL